MEEVRATGEAGVARAAGQEMEVLGWGAAGPGVRAGQGLQSQAGQPGPSHQWCKGLERPPSCGVQKESVLCRATSAPSTQPGAAMVGTRGTEHRRARHGMAREL